MKVRILEISTDIADEMVDYLNAQADEIEQRFAPGATTLINNLRYLAKKLSQGVDIPPRDSERYERQTEKLPKVDPRAPTVSERDPQWCSEITAVEPLDSLNASEDEFDFDEVTAVEEKSPLQWNDGKYVTRT